ncbi:MAG: hypothetical protein EBQ95_00915 [Gammaproteobacteria bacterium]|nr:hypothetical protein [Gammaproteobacteria bacterium]
MLKHLTNKFVLVIVLSAVLLAVYISQIPEKDEPAPPMTAPKVSSNVLKKVKFEQLPQWENVELNKSLDAFKASCELWMKEDPNMSVGSRVISIKVKDWLPICRRAMVLKGHVSTKRAKRFFETYFQVYHWSHYKKGTFTGYYAPTFKGSAHKTDVYKTPIYAYPGDLVSAHLGEFSSMLSHHHIYGHVIGRHLKPYYTRYQIYHGALKGKAEVIAWVKSPLDAMLLEIEGSGVIETGLGRQIYVGYAAENGHRYHAIAQLLINSHVLKRSQASNEAVRKYFDKHPEKMNEYVKKNPSYVFFERYEKPAFKGAQTVSLTPQYSIAVDKHYIPMGVPLFLNTEYPVDAHGDLKPLARLMVAQDTGGSIRGPIRGDIYWGAGEKAMQTASLMSNSGDYWLLLPKHVIAS